MFKIIVFTHGDLCNGLLDSAKMLAGDVSNAQAFSITPGCDLEERERTIKELILSYKEKGEEVLAFTDLFFGTPFNILTRISEHVDFWHITGVNLPLFIEALGKSKAENSTIAEVIPELKELAGTSIICCNDLINNLK